MLFYLLANLLFYLNFNARKGVHRIAISPFAYSELTCLTQLI